MKTNGKLMYTKIISYLNIYIHLLRSRSKTLFYYI